MSPITTHVLDTARGRPAAGIPVTLEALDAAGRARELGRGMTDTDGRARALHPPHALAAGRYRLTFELEEYFRAQGVRAFYPSVAVTFVVADGAEHHHVPLLLSPFGYSTYRGS